MFSQVGLVASSKSANQTLALEFMALQVIFGSVGPVISTLRSSKPGPGPATNQLASSRMWLVDFKNVGRRPLEK